MNAHAAPARESPPSSVGARRLWEPVIACLALWHVFAVGVYALPLQATDRLTVLLRGTLMSAVTPYIQTTSQWQQWDLFSPNPYTRVSRYTFEVRDAEGAWTPAVTMDASSFPIFRRAALLKLFHNILDDANPLLTQRLMRHLCADRGLAAGTPVRLRMEAYVLPHPPSPMPVAAWRAWQPVFVPLQTAEGTCADPSSAILLHTS